jgi:tRNA dimethylallyltransferase
LLDLGLAENRTAMQALGYRQVVEHLQGLRTLAETMALVKSKTRQFAKRQMTWFRRQLPLEWIVLGERQTARETAPLLTERYRQHRIRHHLDGGVAP